MELWLQKSERMHDFPPRRVDVLWPLWRVKNPDLHNLFVLIYPRSWLSIPASTPSCPSSSHSRRLRPTLLIMDSARVFLGGEQSTGSVRWPTDLPTPGLSGEVTSDALHKVYEYHPSTFVGCSHIPGHAVLVNIRSYQRNQTTIR